MEYGNARTVRLGSGWAPRNVSAYGTLVFGELVKLTLPVLRHYHGDLYNDALWINANMYAEQGGAYVFFYGVRDTGTNIGTHEEHVSGSGNRVYRCTVTLSWLDSCEMIIEKGGPDADNGQAIAHGQALRQAAGNPGWHGGA